MRFLTFFLLVIISTTNCADEIKIGYIDTELVLNNFSLFQKENTQITKEFESKKNELLDLFNHIELIRKSLPNLEKSSSSEAYQQKINSLFELEQSFRVRTENFQNTINNEKIAILLKMEKIINDAIKKLAIEEEYDLILYENAAFVSDQIDISNLILLEIENTSK